MFLSPSALKSMRELRTEHEVREAEGGECFFFFFSSPWFKFDSLLDVKCTEVLVRASVSWRGSTVTAIFPYFPLI